MPETLPWISQKRISLDHVYLLYYISVVLWVAERNSFYHHQLMFSVSIISVNFRLISYELLPITQNLTPPLNELMDFFNLIYGPSKEHHCTPFSVPSWYFLTSSSCFSFSPHSSFHFLLFLLILEFPSLYLNYMYDLELLLTFHFSFWFVQFRKHLLSTLHVSTEHR